MAKDRSIRFLSTLMVAALGAVTISGCSGTEKVEVSSQFNKLPPDVAKSRLDNIMKHRGMNVKDDQKYLPGK
jgi:outer membrane murein-binding lipoprotein Lpp